MTDSHYILLGPVKEAKKKHFFNLFMVLPYDISCRILGSFLPPFRSNDKVYVDLMGPLLAVLLLIGLVTYGNSLKVVKISLTPAEFILWYTILMPTFCFFISKIGKSDISLIEVISVVGYSLFGHLFTLLASFLCFQEKSDFFFFICLAIFGGLSTFRILIIFLRSMDAPGARLVVCASIGILNILSLVFIHFAYMHRSYVYVKH